MFVLFVAMSFIIGCVDRVCQSFLSGNPFFFYFFFFSTIVFGLVVIIFYLSLPVGDKFSSQMTIGTVSWLLG